MKTVVNFYGIFARLTNDPSTSMTVRNHLCPRCEVERRWSRSMLHGDEYPFHALTSDKSLEYKWERQPL